MNKSVNRTIGYARVSSTDQHLEVQLEKLKAAGCAPDDIYSEKLSGTSTTGREELAKALKALRPGDTFICVRLDRLARSVTDLLAIIKRLEDGGVTFKCTDQLVDTSGPMGKFVLTMLGAFAEFEHGIRRERQQDGIVNAKTKDKARRAQGLEAETYKGRPASIDATKVAKLKADGLGASAIAKRLGIGRASVYRVLEA